MGKNQIKIAASAKIVKWSVVTGDVTIGEDSCLLYFSVVRGDAAPVVIGDMVNIQENCTIHTSEGHSVRIGDHVTIGHNTVVHGCMIGSGSLIGMGSVLLDGARIGKQCLIGAGSLITSHTVIPDGSLVMGSPARVKRPLTKKEKQDIMENSYAYKAVSEKLLKNEAD